MLGVAEQLVEERALFVEGALDRQFFNKLLEYLAVSKVAIISLEGKERFRTEFPVFTRLAAFKQLAAYGIIQDGDRDPLATFRSITNLLKKLNLAAPDGPGGVAYQPPKKCGIFILPDNNQPGMLEDLLLTSIKNPAPLHCVKTYWQCLNDSQGLSLPRNPAKFRMKALLAAMEEDTPSIGVAIDKGYWNLDHPSLDPLKTFLKDLFQ